MIDSVVVAPDAGMQAGIRRLLQCEGDIRVCEAMAALPGSDRDLPDRCVLVVGPGVSADTAQWNALLSGDGCRVVVLVPLPGWRRYPASVVQIPMELQGVLLRRAVRRVATHMEATPSASTPDPWTAAR